MALKRAARDLLPKSAPLFNQRLLVRGNKIELEPTPKAIEQALLERLDCLVEFSRTFKCMDSELLALLRLPSRVLYDVKKCGTNDKVILVRTAIRDLVQSAMRGPEKLAVPVCARTGVHCCSANRCKSLLIHCKLFPVASRCFPLCSRCFSLRLG